MSSNLLATYQTDLIEVLAALVFLIVFKLVLVWGMSKISQFVQDDDTREAAEQKVHLELPHAFKAYRWTLALILLVNGLLQALPTLVGVSEANLRSQYTGWLAHYGPGLTTAHTWANHSIASNIWSVIIQLALGAALLSFGKPWAVKVVSGITGLFSLFAWVVLENLGNFGAVNAGILTGVPGAALLLAVLCGLAFLPLSAWKSTHVQSVVSKILTGYWLVVLIVQWLPEDGYWSSTGYHHLKAVPTVGSPFGSMRHSIVNGMATNPVLWNIVIGVLAIVLTIGSFISLSHALKWTWFTVSVLWLVFLWIPSLHSGAGVLYVYPFGSGLVIVGLSALRLFRGEKTAE